MNDISSPRLIAGLVVLFGLGLNLRLPLVGFTPLIPLVREETTWSGTTLGLASGLAVVMFAVMAPVTPRLLARFGSTTVVTIGLAVVCVGVLVRSFSIFGGMLLVGAGIGLLNVLLPVIVKRDFPHRIALATGLYTSALNIGSAIAAAGSVPLAQALGGWRWAAGLTVVPVVVVLVLWVGRRRHGVRVRLAATRRRGPRLSTQPLAWQVTIFMGLQSMSYYVALAWLPTIYADAGMSPVRAGLVLSMSQVGQLVACMIIPLLVGRRQDLRWIAAGVAGLTLIALLALTFVPWAAPLSIGLILGIGHGGTLVVALMLIALRSPDSQTAGRLSGMAQGWGYALAACGPPLAGLVFDVSGGWRIALVLMCLVCVVELVAGVLAGRPRVLARPAARVPAEEERCG